METEGQNDITDNVEDINLTNQLIGEVQGFIFVMRWLIYEFYGFKSLKQEGLLSAADFDALEDDILYIIHKVTCVNQVYETLLVLSRLLNNQDDRLLRKKYRAIEENQSEFFPIEIVAHQEEQRSSRNDV